jgi:hypothetical protein
LTGNWRKSTYSGGSEGGCVEVGSVPWRKSTYSGGQGGDCVEAGTAGGTVLVRDTKDSGAGHVLRVSAETWRAFTGVIRAGRRG